MRQQPEAEDAGFGNRAFWSVGNCSKANEYDFMDVAFHTDYSKELWGSCYNVRGQENNEQKGDMLMRKVSADLSHCDEDWEDKRKPTGGL